MAIQLQPFHAHARPGRRLVEIFCTFAGNMGVSRPVNTPSLVDYFNHRMSIRYTFKA